MDVRPVLERVEELRRRRSFVLVGIGGHGAAGKTTLAAAIPDAQIVGTEEFWDGRGFALTRLRREVLDPLRRGEAACYESFDWAAGQRRDTPRALTPGGTVVVDGVCALHRILRDAYDLRVWVETPSDVRLARALARDGESSRTEWVERWIPSEARYVAADEPVHAADIVVDGTGLPVLSPPT
jgi:uridine kinase